MAAKPQPTSELVPTATTRHKKAKYLTAEQLAALRETLMQIHSAKAQQKPVLVPYGEGRPGPRGHDPQPWDSEDGRKIVCLLCGIWLQSLGGRGGSHDNHIRDAHRDVLGGDLGDPFKSVELRNRLAKERYQDHCQKNGWGRPPIICLRAREHASEIRKTPTGRARVKAHNDGAWKRVQQRLNKDPELKQEYYLKKFHRRMVKKMALLTEDQKARMITCQLCEHDRKQHPERPQYFFETLRNHTKYVHGISMGHYERINPDAPTRGIGFKEESDEYLEKARKAFLGNQPDVKKAKRVLINIKRDEDPATQLRRTLAALLSLEGFGGEGLAVLLYPEVKDAKLAEQRLKQLRIRKKERYQAEIAHVRGMSDGERKELKQLTAAKLRKLLSV